MKNKKFKKRERRKILWIKLKSKKEKWERRRRRKKNRVILKNKPQSFTYFTNSTIFLPIILMAHSNALSTNTERKIKSFASFNDIFKLSKKKKISMKSCGLQILDYYYVRFLQILWNISPNIMHVIFFNFIFQ